MMKKIQSFSDFGKVNEVFGKKSSYSGFSKDSQDKDVQALFTQIAQIIEESPIAFELTEKNDGFDVKGPFGISMWVNVDKQQRPGSPSYNPTYDKTGVRVTIDKTEIASGTPKDLWAKLKKSFEFKQFVKGAKIEKMRKGRIDRIVKDMEKMGDSGPDSDRDKMDRLLADYLYYMEPKINVTKRDNSGPWATTASSAQEYAYDLNPVMDAWGMDHEEMSNMLEDNKEDINKKLGNKSSYMVDRKVTKYELTGEGSLVIAVETTVWQN